MRKIALVLVLFVSLIACQSDDSLGYQYEILPVESAAIPSLMMVGNEYDVTVSFT
ncbi:MAG: hypothetical protein HRT68_06560, partial [Flavobacteriaceae bacterium]|nr:hypothetical protein [Flavobacteriaceae bacterium]